MEKERTCIKINAKCKKVEFAWCITRCLRNYLIREIEIVCKYKIYCCETRKLCTGLEKPVLLSGVERKVIYASCEALERTLSRYNNNFGTYYFFLFQKLFEHNKTTTSVFLLFFFQQVCHECARAFVITMLSRCVDHWRWYGLRIEQ